jgi:hypothetical protein
MTRELPRLEIPGVYTDTEEDLNRRMSENRSMYRLFGNSEITDGDIKRYVDSQKAFADRQKFPMYLGPESELPEQARFKWMCEEFDASGPKETEDIFELSKHIESLNGGHQFAFLMKMSNSSHEMARGVALNLVALLPENLRLEFVRKAVNDESAGVRHKALTCVGFLHGPNHRKGIVEVAVGDRNSRISIEALHMLIGVVYELNGTGIDDRSELLTTVANHSNLHDHSQDDFFRKVSHGKKEGDKTVLLDKVPGIQGSLKEHAIMRRMPWSSFRAWKLAFESCDFWKDAGFDYVPVEPIARVRRGSIAGSFNGGNLDIFTRVLRGPTFTAWEMETMMHVDKISSDIDRIISGLHKLGIGHGHPHGSNFVLTFNRDANDTAQIYTAPRVYIIDFDEASLIKSM